MIQTSDVPGIPVPEIPESGSGWLKALQGLSFDDAISNMANGLVSFSFKLLIAILVFYVGKYIIRKIYKVVYTVMVNRNMDPSLTTFVLSFIKMVLYFILIITVIGIWFHHLQRPRHGSWKGAYPYELYKILHPLHRHQQ